MGSSGSKAYGAALVAAALLASGTASAQTDAELFEQGVAALRQENYEQAITVFETLADRGMAHPDVTYDRGLAYLGRVRVKQERPGDLGRAAAAFEETVRLRRGDDEARAALQLVRAEVIRRGARSGASDQVPRPSFARTLVGAAPEAVWAWLALIGSVCGAIGLVLRKAKRPAARLTGMIQAPIGLAVLVVFAGLTAGARHVRRTSVPAVVVVPEARIVDESGIALPSEPPIAEATLVEVTQRKAGLAKVRYGQRVCWTHASSLRTIRVAE